MLILKNAFAGCIKWQASLFAAEYQGLLKGIRENDTEEKKMTDKETTEKKEL